MKPDQDEEMEKKLFQKKKYENEKILSKTFYKKNQTLSLFPLKKGDGNEEKLI